MLFHSFLILLRVINPNLDFDWYYLNRETLNSSMRIPKSTTTLYGRLLLPVPLALVCLLSIPSFIYLSIYLSVSFIVNQCCWSSSSLYIFVANADCSSCLGGNSSSCRWCISSQSCVVSTQLSSCGSWVSNPNYCSQIGIPFYPSILYIYLIFIYLSIWSNLWKSKLINLYLHTIGYKPTMDNHPLPSLFIFIRRMWRFHWLQLLY